METEQLRAEAKDAVAHFWGTRQLQAKKQAGSGKADKGARAAVTGGAQMDGFVSLFAKIIEQGGVPSSAIFRKKAIELPGFFRPTKEWDLLVALDGQLLLVLEAKSQIGPSFGNNFNNRTEEAMGSALDLWTAFREGAFNKSIRPWLGYLMLLEDCEGSRTPVKVAEPHFKVFKEFRNASYAKRYELFCRKLMREGHYSSTCFLASEATSGLHGDYVEPSSRSHPHSIRSLLICSCPDSRWKKALTMPKDGCPLRTQHKLVRGDARDLSFIRDASVHLVVTSPPYWTLKRYEENPNQLGHVVDYERFLACLKQVWEECYRVLVPGGRLICVVGDVCLSRKAFGRHVVVPLHADICVICRRIGFDNLNPIIWHKISNANYEVQNGTKFLGKPYEPNAIIKNDIEFILMQRKPGGYRQPTLEQRRLSMLSKEEFDAWFAQFWKITGASTKEHPAPFPIELAYRLVRMFSFVGDTVLDPFLGSGTTMIAAMRSGRHSIGVDIEETYLKMARRRILAEQQDVLHKCLLVEERRNAPRQNRRVLKPVAVS